MNRTDLLFLLRTGPLTDWEKDFLHSFEKTKEPSLKQVGWLHRIAAKYLSGGPEPPPPALPENPEDWPF